MQVAHEIQSTKRTLKCGYFCVKSFINQRNDLCYSGFKFFRETCPFYFHDLYRQSGQNQANRRSSVLKLKHPLRNTCSGQKNLPYLIPIVWNSLPTDLNPTKILTSHQRCFNVVDQRWNNVDLTLKMKQNPTSDFQWSTMLIQRQCPTLKQRRKNVT